MELRQAANGRGALSLTGGADAQADPTAGRRGRLGLASGEDVQAGRYAARAESAAERAEQSAAAAEGAQLHAPIPGDSGNWLLWDRQTGDYADSGMNSRGEPGPSAWEMAVRGGYKGTEEAFMAALAQIGWNGPDTDGLAVVDDEGNTWYLRTGEGGRGDIVVRDEEGNFWHFTASHSGGEETLPSGGEAGDVLMRTENGCAWIAPANRAEEDNTRPITAAGVYTLVGNIDALLATI